QRGFSSTAAEPSSGVGTTAATRRVESGGVLPSQTAAVRHTKIYREAPTTTGMSKEQKDKAIKAAVAQALTGGKEAADREAVAKDLTDSGTNAQAWFSGMVPDATFLGITIAASGGGKAPGVHQELNKVLKAAEKELQARYPGESLHEIARKLGVHDVKGLRPPKKATGGRRPRKHRFGRGIDINYRENP